MDRHAQMRELWDDHNAAQRFEHDLINRKTTWLLTTQTILFASYGVTFRAPDGDGMLEVFRVVVSVSGLLIALTMSYGVEKLIESKEKSWQQYRDRFTAEALVDPLGNPELRWGVDTEHTRKTLLPDRLLPCVFIAAWCVLLVAQGVMAL